jgi:hypothetical protein
MIQFYLAFWIRHNNQRSSRETRPSVSFVKDSVIILIWSSGRGIMFINYGYYVIQGQADINIMNQAKQISGLIPMKAYAYSYPS